MRKATKITVDQNQQLMTLVVRNHLPAHKQALVTVRYIPRCPYLFAARRGNGGVIIETHIGFSHRRCHELMKRAAMAALEIIEDRTHSVKIGENDA
jgi:hypothetical protein